MFPGCFRICRDGPIPCEFPAFSLQVPLTSDTFGTLVNLLAAPERFSNAFANSCGLHFADADSLAQVLSSVTNVTYDTTDPGDPLLIYHVHLVPSVSQTSVPLNFSEQVGNLSNLSYCGAVNGDS